MAIIKWNRDIPDFSNFFENFFNNDFYNSMKTVPSVNVLENKENYIIEVAAPGLNKDDFKINIENNFLTIESNKNEKNEEANDRFTKREFCFSKFQRSFSIPDSIDSDKIDAKYKDGILSIILPKKEEIKKKLMRQISIKD